MKQKSEVIYIYIDNDKYIILSVSKDIFVYISGYNINLSEKLDESLI